MIPLAVPIAFAVLALVAWQYDARARRAHEATLNPDEKRQFRALRRIRPANWRGIMALRRAETGVAAAPKGEPRAAEKKSPSANRRRRARRDKTGPQKRKVAKKR